MTYFPLNDIIDINILIEKGGFFMAKYVCSVCGYVHEGDEPPAECPVCHVGADKFNKVEGELTLASEHTLDLP